MKVKVNSPFFDVEAKTPRKAGDVFDASEKRVKAINAAGYGELVSVVEQPAPKKKAKKQEKE